jgi:F-type H+-transporting ATPase subunit gamma
MADLERIQSRLDNIQSVEPILSALRTISLGSWQAALNRRSSVQDFEQRLTTLMSLLALQVPRAAAHWPKQETNCASGPKRGVAMVVVIGSERGLCGQFNTSVVEAFEKYLTRQSGDNLELVALGNRIARALMRRNHTPVLTGTLSLTRLPTYELTHRLAQSWLARYERYELDTVDLIYNTYQGVGSYEPTTTRIIPPQIPTSIEATECEPWASPIIETDPISLYLHTVQQWTAVTFYSYLLDAAAAEHAARYTLMEGATQNAGRLIDELRLALQSARQQAITTEMQELAVGAGLLGTDRTR